ncbi:hypothetical protein PV797_03175 [Clostridiaceae bacterium M8S5]|nr:hypothetical protein PV797_03175 [Clostridiaceae bacterium M8S5]
MYIILFVISTIFFGLLGLGMKLGIAGFIFGGLFIVVYQLQVIIGMLKNKNPDTKKTSGYSYKSRY